MPAAVGVASKEDEQGNPNRQHGVFFEDLDLVCRGSDLHDLVARGCLSGGVPIVCSRNICSFSNFKVIEGFMVIGFKKDS